MDGVLQQISLFIQQAKVDAPGVNANGGKIPQRLCLCNALLNLMEQPQNIPIEGSAHHDGVIVKAVYLRQLNPASVKIRQHRPAAGSAKIEYKHFLTHCAISFSDIVSTGSA